MALCVRSVSNKIVPFNGAVSSRNNVDNLLKKVPVRSQFLEEFLSIRQSSSCQIHKYKNDCTSDKGLAPTYQFLYSKEFTYRLDKTSNSIWWTQTIDTGDNKLRVRVKKYTPTQDDIMLWSPNVNLFTSTKNQYDSRFSNLTHYPVKHQETLTLADLQNQMTLLSSGKIAFQQQGLEQSIMACSTGEPSKSHGDKPSAETLKIVFHNLEHSLPRMFTAPLDIKLYHNNVVLINNIRNIKTQGLHNYVKHVAFVKIVANLKFAYVRLDLLRMTQHDEESCIRVRWRISGLSALKVMFTFWRFKIWDIKNVKSHEESWYDGLSTFYVGGDGLIHTHVIDKVTPDDSFAVNDNKSTVAAKLALLLGLMPRSSLPEAYSFLFSAADLQKGPSLGKLAFPLEKIK